MERLRRHAAAERPNEACAILSGPDPQTVSTLHLARNAARSPYRFDVDADDLVRIVHAVEAAGERVVAVAHSHPRGPAVPSPTDRREARWDALHLVVGREGDVRAYRLDGQRTVEIALRLTPRGGGMPSSGHG